MSAVDYAHLVGKYVSMSRPWAPGDHPEDPEIGGEGIVVMVHDGPDGTLICWDYGMGFVVPHDGSSTWSFGVWPDEATRAEWKKYR